MIGRKLVGFGLFAAATVALALLGGLLAYSQVSAQDPEIRAGSATTVTGQQATVDVEALNPPAAGYGGWDIDVDYDDAVVSVAACDEQESEVCNTNVAGTVKVVGFDATGLTQDSVLATITFECEAEGSSDLTLTVNELVDATPGAPAAIDATTTDGSVTCTGTPTPAPPTATPTPAPPAPPTATPTPAVPIPAPKAPGLGGGSGDGGMGALAWLALGLGSAAALAAAGGILALRRRAKA